MEEYIVEVFLGNGTGTLEELGTLERLGTVVRCLGLYASEEELKQLRRCTIEDLSEWSSARKNVAVDLGKVQLVIDGLSQDMKDSKWTNRQIRIMEGKKKDLEGMIAFCLVKVQEGRQEGRENAFKELGVPIKDTHTDESATAVDINAFKDVHERLSAAWYDEYEGTKVLEYLLKNLDVYVDGWTKDAAYIAPWTSIVQSSGWGKSRSICELSTKGVYIVYISFSERAIPHGTPGARFHFVGVKNNVRRIASAFVGCLDHLATEIEKGQSPQQLVAKQTSAEENLWQGYQWGRLQTEVSALSKCECADTTLDLWDDRHLKDWMVEKMGVLQKRIGVKGRESGLRLLFCLDEAGELFAVEPNLFMVMRRAFSCFPRGAGIFAVLIDTSAKLRMLAPTRLANPSLKGRLPDAKVFPPLCITGVASFNHKDLRSIQCGICDFKDTARVLFSAGRPLWKACLLGEDAVSLDIAIAYATQKLLGGISLTDLWGKTTFSESMAIGILSASIAIEVVAWSELAETLVASHMRTALVVSEEKDRIFTADVVEPILGEAAARILVNDGLLLKVLDVLEQVCKQAVVLEGPRGELLGRIILMLAMYNCLWKGGKFSQPVPLQTFLSKVCGKEVECAKGNVFFNRCCVVSGELTQSVMLQCYLGCFAVIPRRNQEGFDFVIPVLYAGPDGEFDLAATNMGAIPCQFRDRDSYAINSARLVVWAEHFAFLRPEVSAKEREELLQLEECVELQREHSLKYFEILRNMPDTSEEAAGTWEEDREAAQKAYSDSNKRRRSEPTRMDKGKMIQGTENSIKLSKSVGLYFHLNSPTKSRDKWVMQVDQCIVLHGLQIYSFLNEDVVKRLEGLRTAYHKLENMTKSEDELFCLKQVAWSYFGQFEENLAQPLVDG